MKKQPITRVGPGEKMQRLKHLDALKCKTWGAIQIRPATMAKLLALRAGADRDPAAASSGLIRRAAELMDEATKKGGKPNG